MKSAFVGACNLRDRICTACAQLGQQQCTAYRMDPTIALYLVMLCSSRRSLSGNSSIFRPGDTMSQWYLGRRSLPSHAPRAHCHMGPTPQLSENGRCMHTRGGHVLHCTLKWRPRCVCCWPPRTAGTVLSALASDLICGASVRRCLEAPSVRAMWGYGSCQAHAK